MILLLFLLLDCCWFMQSMFLKSFSLPSLKMPYFNSLKIYDSYKIHGCKLLLAHQDNSLYLGLFYFFCEVYFLSNFISFASNNFIFCLKMFLFGLVLSINFTMMCLRIIFEFILFGFLCFLSFGYFLFKHYFVCTHSLSASLY